MRLLALTTDIAETDAVARRATIVRSGSGRVEKARTGRRTPDPGVGQNALEARLRRVVPAWCATTALVA
jgi:hypothetical protein